MTKLDIENGLLIDSNNLEINMLKQLTQKQITTGSGIIGGSVVMVDPSYVGAVDDLNKNTPFVTIQAAIDICPEFGTVLLAPANSFVEDIVINKSISIIGMANQRISLQSGCSYIKGEITLSSGKNLVLQNVYLENNVDGKSNIISDAISTTQLFANNTYFANNQSAANSHNIKATNTGQLFITLENCELYTSGTNRSIESSSGNSICVFYNVLFNNDIEINGGLYAENCFFTKLYLLSNTTSTTIDKSRFSDFIENFGSGPIFLYDCNFSGDYDNFIVSTVPVGVQTDKISFAFIGSNTGNKFKGVSGCVHYPFGALDSEILINRIKNIDGTSNTPVDLFLVPNLPNIRFICTKVVLRLISQTGLSGTLSAGVGTNVSFDDIFTSVPLTGFNSVEQCYTFINSGLNKIIQPNSIIKLELDTPFAGIVELEADIFGYITYA